MKPNKLFKKKLIISLIKSDLINHKLVSGLDELGLDALNYHLYLSELIFELMDFPFGTKSDQTFVYYLKRLKETKKINFKGNHEPLEALAKDIYNELKNKRKLVTNYITRK